jgi:glycosyltransferase involved in cell wall biosynthesis
VTTLAPGCKETVLEGQTGFLVPPRDPVALANAMGRFIEEPSLIPKMGIAARALAEDKYDVNKVNAVILKALGL